MSGNKRLPTWTAATGTGAFGTKSGCSSKWSGMRSRPRSTASRQRQATRRPRRDGPALRHARRLTRNQLRLSCAVTDLLGLSVGVFCVAMPAANLTRIRDLRREDRQPDRPQRRFLDHSALGDLAPPAKHPADSTSPPTSATRPRPGSAPPQRPPPPPSSSSSPSPPCPFAAAERKPADHSQLGDVIRRFTQTTGPVSGATGPVVAHQRFSTWARIRRS